MTGAREAVAEALAELYSPKAAVAYRAGSQAAGYWNVRADAAIVAMHEHHAAEVARAVAAETERCAKVADGVAEMYLGAWAICHSNERWESHRAAQLVAAAIRTPAVDLGDAVRQGEVA